MYVLLALAMLSVLIVTHELGHFLAARACGIAVQEFSVGMGPLLFKRTGKRGTQFSLRALPIGGFCMFDSEDDPQRGRRAFGAQPVPARMFTVASGPLMNFVVAFLVIVFFVSVLMLLYALFAKFAGQTTAGWASLMGSIWLLGGIQLLGLGVVGEYIGKIYNETKRRPRFIIESVLNKD